MAWASQPYDIEQRMARGVRYVVLGQNKNGMVELTGDSPDHTISLAQRWVDQHANSIAYCFCVQDGVIGGRPFMSARQT